MVASPLCLTRALKNIRQLQQVVPDLLPRIEPEDGFMSLLPASVLARLERSIDDPRTTLPPELAKHRSRIQLSRPGTTATQPLFSGTLRFVSLQVRVGAGTTQVAPGDLNVAQKFAGVAVGPISRYARQYGPNALAVSDPVLAFAVSLPKGRYNNQSLERWVGELASREGLSAADCLVFLNPPGAENADALPSKGILGYHSFAQLPYIFVNPTGSGFSLDDPPDRFALALSHEIAEMVVDPRADLSNPEVCDPCGPNCQTPFRDYFDPAGAYLGTSTAFPPPYAYGFYLNAIVQPASASACPAPPAACVYAPP